MSVSCWNNALTISVNTETHIALPAHRLWVFSFGGHLYSSVGTPCNRKVSGPDNRLPLESNQKPLDTPESKHGETDCDCAPHFRERSMFIIRCCNFQLIPKFSHRFCSSWTWRLATTPSGKFNTLSPARGGSRMVSKFVVPVPVGKRKPPGSKQLEFQQ